VRDYRASFGRRIRARREELGLSQEQLAERAGLHWTFVSGVERGVRNPGLNTIGKIAVALGWTLSQTVEDVAGSNRVNAKRAKPR
jgi:transcriptional regulator with XRE-family HTH domain